MRAPRGGLAARGRWRTGLGVHVTQFLKKETEAETPERAGEGEGEEAKPHAGCPSSGRRRVGSVEELEREPGLGEAEPGWAVRCSSLHPRPSSGRETGLPIPQSRLSAETPILIWTALVMRPHHNVGGESSIILIRVATPEFIPPPPKLTTPTLPAKPVGTGAKGLIR